MKSSDKIIAEKVEEIKDVLEDIKYKFSEELDTAIWAFSDKEEREKLLDDTVYDVFKFIIEKVKKEEYEKLKNRMKMARICLTP